MSGAGGFALCALDDAGAVLVGALIPEHVFRLLPVVLVEHALISTTVSSS
jgi:hypothetical protein